LAVGQAHHRYAILHRTNEGAKITPDTIFFTHFGNRLARHPARTETVAVGGDEINALVRAVLPSELTEVAADAILVIEPSDALIIQIQRIPCLQRSDGAATEFSKALKSFGVEVIV